MALFIYGFHGIGKLVYTVKRAVFSVCRKSTERRQGVYGRDEIAIIRGELCRGFGEQVREEQILTDIVDIVGELKIGKDQPLGRIAARFV